MKKWEKIPVPSDVITFCLFGTPCAGQKQIEQQSFSQPRMLPVPLSGHLATDSVRVTLSSLSAPVSPIAHLA